MARVFYFNYQIVNDVSNFYHLNLAFRAHIA